MINIIGQYKAVADKAPSAAATASLSEVRELHLRSDEKRAG